MHRFRSTKDYSQGQQGHTSLRETRNTNHRRNTILATGINSTESQLNLNDGPNPLHDNVLDGDDIQAHNNHTTRTANAICNSDSPNGNRDLHEGPTIHENLPTADAEFTSTDQQSTTSKLNNDSQSTISDIQQCERDDILKHCRDCSRRVATWSRLLSFCAISGPVHFSARQYTILAIAVRTASLDTIKLATYKTIRTTQWDFMRTHLFTKSRTFFVKGNTRRYYRLEQVQKVQTVNKGLQDPRDCVRILLPSDWAKLDILTIPLFNQLFGTRPTSQEELTIEHAPLVYDGDRSLYLSGTRALWAYYKNSVLPAEPGEPLLYLYNKYQVFQEPTNFDSVFFTDIGEDSYIKVSLGPTWCVRKHISGSDINSSIGLQEPKDLSDDELLLYLYTCCASHTLRDFEGATKQRTQQDNQHTSDTESTVPVRTPNDSNLYTFPGDVCAILRPHASTNDTSICVLIASHIWREDGRMGERIVWIDRQQLRSTLRSVLNSLNSHPLSDNTQLFQLVKNVDNREKLARHLSSIPIDIPLKAFASIPQLPLFQSNHTPRYSGRTASECPRVQNQGVMSDGTPYLVYRFILYTDGFKQKKSLSDRRSVNGCYMLPVGLPHRTKSSCLCVRTLSLGAYGQNPNDIMKHIIPDIIEGSTKGYTCIDAHGRKVRLFLDLIAAFGDFPALTSQGDLSGHSADAHCSFCGVVKRKGGTCAPICNTVTRHSRRPSLMRFDEAMSNIRDGEVPQSVRKHLGTSCSTEEEATNRFAISIANALRQIKANQEDSDTGIFSAGYTFDSYLSAHVAPDHMFKNLISNVLTVCFNYATDDERTLWDVQICTEIARHNLPTIDTLLKKDKHGKYIGINNISTSDLFCALPFAAHLFSLHSERYGDLVHPFHLPQQLQDIISLSYWWPKSTTSTEEEVSYVIGEKGSKPLQYWNDIQDKCDRYITSIGHYYEKGGKDAGILDKPNAHRLLEFAYCTLPTFGHTLNVVELVLEQAHRLFKEWLEKNTNHNAHLSAVDIAIGKDWMTRAFAAYTIWVNGTPDERRSAEISLTRLLLGANAMKLDRTDHEVEVFFEEFFSSLPDAFKSPVIDELQGTSGTSILEIIEERWVLSNQRDVLYKSQLKQAVRNLPQVEDTRSPRLSLFS